MIIKDQWKELRPGSVLISPNEKERTVLRIYGMQVEITSAISGKGPVYKSYSEIREWEIK